MPINLQKIQTLLYKVGFIIDTFFVISEKCEYIKCNSINTGETLVIKICRSFSFRPRAPNIYNLNLIDFEVGENIAEKYSEYPSKKDLKKKYGGMLKLATTVNEEEMEADLENKYKMNLELKSIERDQLIVVKSCFRQLRRISLVLTGLKYKVCIINQQYFTVVNGDDVIDSFYIRSYDCANPARRFYVMVDLEYFYEKIQSIDYDIQAIQESIYTVLDRNSVETGEVFAQISAELPKHEGNSANINQIKIMTQESIMKLKAQLVTLNTTQAALLEEHGELNTKSTSYFNDASIISKKGIIKKKIDSVDIEKQKILRDLETFKKKVDHIYLCADNIEFDNCIMMNGILKNMQEIKSVAKVS